MGLYTYIQFAYDKHKHVHVLFLLYCPLNIYWLISASVLNCLPAVTVIILQSLLYLSREHQVFSYQSAPSKRQSSELVGTEFPIHAYSTHAKIITAGYLCTGTFTNVYSCIKFFACTGHLAAQIAIFEVACDKYDYFWQRYNIHNLVQQTEKNIPNMETTLTYST